MESIPSHTLYINNLNEKIKKDVLKKVLYMLFSQYGRVIQIVACKGMKMRGQAWVVFQDVTAASTALKGKQGFQFFGKPMKIQFSKSTSKVISQKEGVSSTSSSARAATKRSREELEDGKMGEEETASKEPRIAENAKPNRILFVQHLPADTAWEDILQSIFKNCPGFVEVRSVASNSTIAFVEFENEIQAGIAQKQLNGIPLSGNALLQISFSN